MIIIKDIFKTLEKVRTALLKFWAFYLYNIMNHSENYSIKDIVYFCDFDFVKKTEQWKDVKDFEGLYQISDLGRVKSYRNKHVKILKVRLSVGYNRIRLYNPKANNLNNYFLVHTLVANHFLSKNEDSTKNIINHKNKNTLDNRVFNLEFASVRDNKIHSLIGSKKSSKFTNVAWHKPLNKWRASISFNLKYYHLGYRNSEEEAYDLVLAFKEKHNINTIY